MPSMQSRVNTLPAVTLFVVMRRAEQGIPTEPFDYLDLTTAATTRAGALALGATHDQDFPGLGRSRPIQCVVECRADVLTVAN